ncbi:MAG: hypothetical protein QM726_11205 [Chitinophagaceae bacterium]
MPNQINVPLPRDKELANKVLDNHNNLEKERVNQGYLGKIWGSSSSIPNNVAALSVIILILTGIGYTYCMMTTPLDRIPLSIKDFWSIISPLITLAIGYLFGDKKPTRGK